MPEPAPLRLAVPGSKSETQRALLLAALAPGRSELCGPLDCDDSRWLRRALRACGASISEEPRRWWVEGGWLRAPAQVIDCGEGGTTLRFLAPLALHLDGVLSLDGAPRLRERPLGELLTALTALGIEVTGSGALSLPLQLRRLRSAPPRASVDASRSSQFASGLLLSAPLLPGGLELELAGPAVSRPYLDLTLRMMRRFGASVEERPSGLRALPGGYRATRFQVAGDWSSAAFLLAAGFISGRPLELENLATESAQGDRVIVAQLAELGRARSHRLDLTDCPDLLPPLAAAAAFASHPSELCGIAHARVKESDRPAVLARGLRAAGLQVVEAADRLLIEPGSPRPARLDPAGDHRMAMAFGLLSLRQPGIAVSNPACVSKSYPGFWDDLERFR